jgi:hypothetical protein
MTFGVKVSQLQLLQQMSNCQGRKIPTHFLSFFEFCVALAQLRSTKNVFFRINIEVHFNLKNVTFRTEILQYKLFYKPYLAI